MEELLSIELILMEAGANRMVVKTAAERAINGKYFKIHGSRLACYNHAYKLLCENNH